MTSKSDWISNALAQIRKAHIRKPPSIAHLRLMFASGSRWDCRLRLFPSV
jgi:hypothetical protein